MATGIIPNPERLTLYTASQQFGASNGSTPQDLFNALPKSSLAILACSAIRTADLPDQADAGTIIMYKSYGGAGRAGLFIVRKAGLYRGVISSVDGSIVPTGEWKKVVEQESLSLTYTRGEASDVQILSSFLTGKLLHLCFICPIATTTVGWHTLFTLTNASVATTAYGMVLDSAGRPLMLRANTDETVAIYQYTTNSPVNVRGEITIVVA